MKNITHITYNEACELIAEALAHRDGLEYPRFRLKHRKFRVEGFSTIDSTQPIVRFEATEIDEK